MGASSSVVRRLERVQRSGVRGVCGPAGVLLNEVEASAWFASLVEEVLGSSSPADSRAVALCQLLDLFGVGYMVTGRLS